MDIARYSLTKPINIWLIALCFIIGGVIAMGKIGQLEILLLPLNKLLFLHIIQVPVPKK